MLGVFFCVVMESVKDYVGVVGGCDRKLGVKIFKV